MAELHWQTFRRRDGSPARVVEMRDAGGIVVRISSLGATLMAIEAPDRHGRQANVLLGWDDPRCYDAQAYEARNPYLGASIGRFANRIAGAHFTIDGRHYGLSANEGSTHLHGGADGFDRRTWEAEPPLENGVRLSLVSEDGDQGYPGRLEARVDYLLTAPNELAIVYTAETDRATHVNLVSHGYFNLTGDPGAGIGGHSLSIAASRYAPIGGDNLPLGEFAPVAGTPYDLRNATSLAEALRAVDDATGSARGFNHCYLRDSWGKLGAAARLHEPDSGRVLEIATDQPGLLFYSGDGLDGRFASADGIPFGPRSALCLETQNLPDAPNQPAFPSSRLDPGEVYRSETRLRFGTDETG